MRILILLFVLTIQILYGEVEDHFKKVGDKSAPSKMENIDFIYMINLDERPEKFEFCLKQLAPYNIYPHRFSAVNGWKLSLKAIDDVGVKYGPWMPGENWGTCYLTDQNGQPQHEIVSKVGRTYFAHCMSRGAIGIALSHLSILQDAYDSGYETIWVMEDDIQVIRDPLLLSDLINKLDALVGKNGWDILFTDRDTKNGQGDYVPCSAFAWRPNFSPPNPGKFAEKEDVSADFRRVGSRYGAYSMIVRRSGMKKMLDFMKCYHIFLPYDMDNVFCQMNLYTVMDDVVSTHPGAISDNGGPNYEK